MEEEIRMELSPYMWHIGRILTELMIILDSTGSPIIVETFKAASELFDTLGECAYNNKSLNYIFPKVIKFIEL